MPRTHRLSLSHIEEASRTIDPGHAGLVLEPSGAAGLAALLSHAGRFRGRTVATVLCGGNLTPEQMELWLA